jgi:hypothetical protein
MSAMPPVVGAESEPRAQGSPASLRGGKGVIRVEAPSLSQGVQAVSK